jgi:hypothetical protein
VGGRATLAEVRACQDTSRGGEVAKKRAAAIAKWVAEEAAWNAEHRRETYDKTLFNAENLPTLEGLSRSAIPVAAGLSQQYCSPLQCGLKIPSPRCWQALVDAVSLKH